MKIGTNPVVMEAVFAARREAIALSEEKSRNTVAAAHTSTGGHPTTDHMRASGKTAGIDVNNLTQSAIERIREIGMSAYAEEVKAAKIEQMKEELRKQILGAMGLTEEDLANMPATQRAHIEKLIEDEIQKRLAAINEMNGDDDKNSKTGLLNPVGNPHPDSTGKSMKGNLISRTSEIGPGMAPGMGVLLALQEAEQESGTKAGAEPDSGKKPEQE